MFKDTLFVDMLIWLIVDLLMCYKAKLIVKKFLKEDFLNEEPYKNRIKQLEEIEKRNK